MRIGDKTGTEVYLVKIDEHVVVLDLEKGAAAMAYSLGEISDHAGLWVKLAGEDLKDGEYAELSDGQVKSVFDWETFSGSMPL